MSGKTTEHFKVKTMLNIIAKHSNFHSIFPWTLFNELLLSRLASVLNAPLVVLGFLIKKSILIFDWLKSDQSDKICMVVLQVLITTFIIKFCFSNSSVVTGMKMWFL